jgi:hypothetical protein
MKSISIHCLLVLLPSIAAAQAARELPLKYSGPATVAAITPGDLMSRLYRFADDSMMGREAGTIHNQRAIDYIAAELRRLELKPAGDNGTFVQNPLRVHSIDSASSISVDGVTLRMWTDFIPRDQGRGARQFDATSVVYGGMIRLNEDLGQIDWSGLIDSTAAKGRVVVVTLQEDAQGKAIQPLANRAQITRRLSTAAAIAVRIIDDLTPDFVQSLFISPQIEPKGGEVPPSVPSYFYVTDAAAMRLLGSDPAKASAGQSGRVVRGAIRFIDKDAPGGNVVAILPGSDPGLRGQYVAIGAHNDHVGTASRAVESDSLRARNIVLAPQGADGDNLPDSLVTADQLKLIRHMIDSMRSLHGAPRLDSIANGADDDGSGSMSMLEIAEAFAKSPGRPRRSMLFVWHTGEELGLYGSRYFTDNPTVPRDSIVAQLNLDMIGRGGANDVTGETREGALLRGGPGYLQVVGSRRLSTELGDLVELVNAEGKFGMRFDYAMDANGHPQVIYCRSDHYEYARYGIPIAFFTTGGHADYHMVTDEPQYIDYDHMSSIANYVKALATRVANLDHRLVVDRPKPDPRGQCRQ